MLSQLFPRSPLLQAFSVLGIFKVSLLFYYCGATEVQPWCNRRADYEGKK